MKMQLIYYRACFKKLPRILCFNTMRYTFNMVTMMKEKVNTHFSFPLCLDMSQYMEKNLMGPDKLRGKKGCLGWHKYVNLCTTGCYTIYSTCILMGWKTMIIWSMLDALNWPFSGKGNSKIILFCGTDKEVLWNVLGEFKDRTIVFACI